MSGDAVERHRFCTLWTEAFAPAQVAATRARLGTLDPAQDHLDILDRLGLLFFLQPGQLPRYRERLGIPPLNQAIITRTLHYCLDHQPGPMPMHVNVIAGPAEQVQVTVADGMVYLLIVRTDYEDTRNLATGAADA